MMTLNPIGSPTMLPYNGGNIQQPITLSPTNIKIETLKPSIAIILNKITSALPSATPTMSPTLSPTNIPTAFPTSNKPTLNPTNSPTEISTQNNNVIESSGSADTSPNNKQTTTIVAVVSVIVVMIIMGVILAFCLRKKGKNTPFEKWSTYYDNRPTIENNTTEDIHHFYRKDVLSMRNSEFNNGPAFTPYVSNNLRTTIRPQSNIDMVDYKKRGPNQNKKRLSINC
jgi:hypothetical protein